MGAKKFQFCGVVLLFNNLASNNWLLSIYDVLLVMRYPKFSNLLGVVVSLE
uniref:Uncharacterized protein n=1 Tax=Arundo donax TaxID=35708 RepID=A0A0A9H841_ARUDO